jgi:hypothetical protein
MFIWCEHIFHLIFHVVNLLLGKKAWPVVLCCKYLGANISYYSQKLFPLTDVLVVTVKIR